MDIQIQLTTRCNERCVFCKKYTWEQKEMSESTLLQTFLKYPSRKNKYQFSGGDPLCYSNLNLLNHLLSDAKYKVYTNLAFDLNEEQKMFLNNASDISVSFDGVNFQTYNKIRRPLSDLAFAKMVKNVIDYRDKVRLCMVVTKDNMHEIPEVLSFGHRYKIKTRFYELHTNLETQPDISELKKILESIDFEQVYNTNILSVYSKVCSGKWGEPNRFDSCFVKDLHHVIDESGFEYPCCYAINDNGDDLKGQNSIGNVYDMTPKKLNHFLEYDFCYRCTRYQRTNEMIRQLIQVEFY